MDFAFLMKWGVFCSIGLLFFFMLWNAVTPLLGGRDASVLTVLFFFPVVVVAKVVYNIFSGDKNEARG